MEGEESGKKMSPEEIELLLGKNCYLKSLFLSSK